MLSNFFTKLFRPTVQVLFKRLQLTAKIPVQAYEGDAGFDLYACLVYSEHPVVIKPNERALVGCGFAMALPDGWEAQVRPRSGNAIKMGLGVLNSPGTIDCGYRDEVKVILINHSNSDIVVNHLDKIAQMVISQTPKVVIKEVNDLPLSERGKRGFGSSDKK